MHCYGQTSNTLLESKFKQADEYLSGINGSYNPTKAIALFEECAQLGMPKAMNALGIVYRQGKGVKKDYTKAFEWFRKSSESSYPSAWSNLGLMYKYGTGTELNYEKAFACFEQAAKLGTPAGYYAQGYMLYKGLGCTQDYGRAVQLFRKGIAKNSTSCMYFLGICMRNGYGVSQDLDSAKYWLLKATRNGFQLANDELSKPEAENISLSGKLVDKVEQAKKIAETNKNPVNQYTKIPTEFLLEDIEGVYSGYILKYDYAGKSIVQASKLELNMLYDSKTQKIQGEWTEDDSLKINLNATLTKDGLQFKEMAYDKADYWSGKQLIKFDINNASLKRIKNTDGYFLTGNVDMYNSSKKEPEKPLQLVLQRIKKGQNVGSISFNDNNQSLIVFPNPFTDILNIEFSLAKSSNVEARIITVDGKIIYTQAPVKLDVGKYVLPLQPNIAAGTYIVQLIIDGKSKTAKIIKR